MTAPAAAPSRGPLAAAEERGQLTIAPRVVEQIVAAVATEVDGVVVRHHRMVNRGAGALRATADLQGSSARIKLSLSVRYPRPVQPTVAAVRQRVIATLAELADISPTQVDISVSELLPEQADTRRRVE